MKQDDKQKFSRAVREEADPAWRNWFMEVELRRKALADPKDRPLIFSDYDKDGQRGSVIRPKSEPAKIGKLVRKAEKELGLRLTRDLGELRELWREAAGEAIGNESWVESFANGVLQVRVGSSALLLEIRQFHKETILQALRERWRLEVPLVRVVYKLGKA